MPENNEKKKLDWFDIVLVSLTFLFCAWIFWLFWLGLFPFPHGPGDI